MEVLVDRVDGDSMHLHNIMGEPTFHFCVKMSCQLQNVWVLTCWTLQHKILQKLVVMERTSGQQQRVCEGNKCVAIATNIMPAQLFQQNMQNKPVGHRETFLQRFFIKCVKFLLVPTFCGSYWKSWKKTPSCWRCLAFAGLKGLSNHFSW